MMSISIYDKSLCMLDYQTRILHEQYSEYIDKTIITITINFEGHSYLYKNIYKVRHKLHLYYLTNYYIFLKKQYSYCMILLLHIDFTTLDVISDDIILQLSYISLDNARMFCIWKNNLLEFLEIKITQCVLYLLQRLLILVISNLA